jgi:hypothetical protein
MESKRSNSTWRQKMKEGQVKGKKNRQELEILGSSF